MLIPEIPAPGDDGATKAPVPGTPAKGTPETREESVHRELSLRLKRICEKLSEKDYEALIAKMTREQLRGEGVPRHPGKKP